MMPTFFISTALVTNFLAFAPNVISTSSPDSTKLPVVDLGYNLHRATSFNSTGNFYNFSNIRYAAPPTGENRFRVPQQPETDRSTVQTGLPDRICAQANPAWLNTADQFLELYLAGQTEFNASSFNSTNPEIPQDPRTTEDCLFLDVVVPKTIFDAGKNCKAPVLVWVHGGGYTMASKSYWGNPAGLIARSEEGDNDGVIFVSLNYRLGAFGWLSGPTFQEDGTANVGLYDQRLALDWVKKYIQLFGGDADRITVIGESAGGGSIMHQITAHGGQDSAPFEQAIIQSPGLFPIVSNMVQEDTFNEYLSLLGVGSIDKARKLPFETLQNANLQQVGSSPYGTYTYGPAIDGDFVPALPGELLLHGQFDKNVKVMASHNTDEGLLFTSPFIQNSTAFVNQITTLIPTIAAYPSTLSYITNTLFPLKDYAIPGSTSQIARAAAQIADLSFTCNAVYLSAAFSALEKETYAYYFTVPPAIHGTDVAYTFLNGPNPMVASDDAAVRLQRYISNYARTGDPNGEGLPQFPGYGGGRMVLEMNFTTSVERDPGANERCAWLQKVLYV